VDVADLAGRFGVTPPTIRRDLGWLEEEGLAQRVRGGAIATGSDGQAPDPTHTVAGRIGQAAARRIRDGETLFLGPGRLTLEVAQALGGNERLAVVTNSLKVAQHIAERTSHTLILIGGQLDRANQGLGGRLARRALEDLRADRIFLELSGISAVEGLTNDDLAQAELTQLLLQLGPEATILSAPERIGRVAAAYIAPAVEADAVVTGREADSAPLWDLAELGIEVVLA